MLHPLANKFGHILVHFLFEGGDEVGKIKTSATSSVQHMTQRFVAEVLSVAILQSIKEQQAFCAYYRIVLRLSRISAASGDQFQCAAYRCGAYL